MKFKTSVVLEELEKGMGKGDLTLIISCIKCSANFELNKESVAIAVGTKCSFIEYLRWIQGCKCPCCNGKNAD